MAEEPEAETAPAGADPLAGEAEVFVARTLLEVIAHINGVKSLPQALPDASASASVAYPDLADVRGQLQARRALEIAACGQHHLLLIGSPGCGKTLLASRLPLVPNKEVVFATFAIMLIGSGQALSELMAFIAALCLVAHVVLIALFGVESFITRKKQ